MFYIAEAYLDAERLSFSSHAQVIAAFGIRFAKTGKVKKDFHSNLIKAERIRSKGDYDEKQSVTPEQAQQLIANAQLFLDAAGEYFAFTPPRDRN